MIVRTLSELLGGTSVFLPSTWHRADRLFAQDLAATRESVNRLVVRVAAARRRVLATVPAVRRRARAPRPAARALHPPRILSRGAG